MAKFFDADGNEVEAFTQEELDAKVQEELAKNKPAEQTTTATTTTTTENKDEPPAWAKSLIDQVQKLSGNQRHIFVGEIESKLDADKREAFKTKYDSLTGYDESPDGIRRRAEDAYLLTTGQPYVSSGINIGNVVAAGGAPVKPSAPAPEVDKNIQEVFGIAPEDAAKYAPK